MNTHWSLCTKTLRLIIPGILFLLLGPSPLRAQFLYVDCSGTNPNAYPSINAALPNAGPGAFVLVTGVCNESVSLQSVDHLNLGAFFGQTATINGGISINNSADIHLFGLNVTNPAGEGIDVGNSRSVTLDTCTSNGNGDNGIVIVFAWGGPLDLSGNNAPGLRVAQGSFTTFGHTTIANNRQGPNSDS